MNSNYLCMIVCLFVSYSHGMELSSASAQEQTPEELKHIPAKELKIYQEYNRQQRKHLSQLLVHLGNAFEDKKIPAKRDRKFKKQLARYNAEQKKLIFKGFISAAAAGGFGYCAHKGCTIPETTAASAIISAGCGLLALNYVYDWYNLPKPTYELIAERLEQKINNCHDWRPVIAQKIEKICVPNVVKEK
jgi:hypothetical protein